MNLEMDRTDLKHADRSSKELGYKEKEDSQNSLECSISTFVCVILMNFHVFMMYFFLMFHKFVQIL